MAGQGQGMFTLNGLSYGVIDDVINLVTAPYTTYSIPGISTTNLQYQFITNPPYLATPLLVLKSTAGMWTFDGATVTQVTNGNYPVEMSIQVMNKVDLYSWHQEIEEQPK